MQPSCTVYGAENGPHEFLQSSCMLCGDLNESKKVFPSNTLCGGQNDNASLCNAYARFVVLYTDTTSICKTPTRNAVVKTDPTSFWKPPTRFAVLKT